MQTNIRKLKKCIKNRGTLNKPKMQKSKMQKKNKQKGAKNA